MSTDIQLQNKSGRKYRRPSEQAARFILGIVNWVRDIFTSTTTTVPRGEVFQHQGEYLSAGKALQYPRILLVEDNPHTVQEFIGAIENYYVFGSVKILVAYTYDAAVTFFDNEDINLVIMDADLDDDDGDGAILTERFLRGRPDITILANSSSRISNLKLTGFGALGPLGKSTEKLKSWLLINDPTGSTG